MLNKNEARQRRARKTRARIAEQKTNRLAIHRTNLHIYAQVISACGGKVLASASSAGSGSAQGDGEWWQRQAAAAGRQARSRKGKERWHCRGGI